MPPNPTRTTFYDAVYAFVQCVPRGSVVTYGQVALELGSPSAARAVGYALYFLGGAESVPWWRVVNAAGGISYRGRGPAADRQRELLVAEGVVFDKLEHIDLHKFRWWPNP